MKIALTIVLSLVACALLMFFGFLIQKRLHKKWGKQESTINMDDFVIRMPTFYIWLLIIASIVFIVIIMLCNVFDDMQIWANVLCAVIIFILLLTCVVLVREKTIVKGRAIIHIPSVGKKKELRFSDIKQVICKPQTQMGYVDYILIDKDNKKIFKFTSQFLGATVFLEKCRRLGVEIIY